MSPGCRQWGLTGSLLPVAGGMVQAQVAVSVRTFGSGQVVFGIALCSRHFLLRLFGGTGFRP